MDGVFRIMQRNLVMQLGEERSLGLSVYVREQQVEFEQAQAGETRVAPQLGDNVREHSVDNLRSLTAGARPRLQ
jgi:hypothetical protein